MLNFFGTTNKNLHKTNILITNHSPAIKHETKFSTYTER